MPHMLERFKQLPRGVLAFVALVLLYDVAALLLARRWFHAHPLGGAFWLLMSFGLLAALVIWRQRWAWWIAFIGPLLWLASPAWGERFRPITDLVELVFLAAILTPTMRRHVGVLTHSQATPAPLRSSRPGRAALVASGVLTLFVMVPVEPRHTTGSTGSRIATGVILWLLLAAVIRLIMWLWVGARRRLPHNAGHQPPTG
jgi:hypothetical protein